MAASGHPSPALSSLREHLDLGGLPLLLALALLAVAAARLRRGARGPRAVSFRLLPGEDLAAGVEAAVRRHRLRACHVVSCVGSLTRATLRVAKGRSDRERIVARAESGFEIVSLTGTAEWDPRSDHVTRHLHLSLADDEGKVWGGHVLSKASDGYEADSQLLPVYTTAEVCLLAQEDVVFAREHCARSGWPELVVRRA